MEECGERKKSKEGNKLMEMKKNRIRGNKLNEGRNAQKKERIHGN